MLFPQPSIMKKQQQHQYQNIQSVLFTLCIFSKILISKTEVDNNKHSGSFYGLPGAFADTTSYDPGRSLNTQW